MFSRVLHELAISVAPRTGYGGPTAYFLIHALLVQWRGRPTMRGFLERSPWRRRAWVVGTLVLPLPLLFHAPFLAGGVWPMVGIER